MDKEPINLVLWDASHGCEALSDRLGSLKYSKANGSIICFPIDDPDSLENVRERWMPEVTHFISTEAPIILVGCKKDLRNDPATLGRLDRRGKRPVTYEQGIASRDEIKGRAYLECSALTGEGVREVFLCAAEAAKRYEGLGRSKKAAGCIIT